MIKIIFNNNNKIKTWKSTQSIEIYTIRTHTKKKMITSTSQQKPSDLTRPQNAHRFHFYTHPPHPPSPFYIYHIELSLSKKSGASLLKLHPPSRRAELTTRRGQKRNFFNIFLFGFVRPSLLRQCEKSNFQLIFVCITGPVYFDWKSCVCAQ